MGCGNLDTGQVALLWLGSHITAARGDDAYQTSALKALCISEFLRQIACEREWQRLCSAECGPLH